MTIRTFRAHTPADALAQVKKELGPGAVILHTRTYKSGGVLGVGARSVTEITATKDMHVERRAPARADRADRAVQPPARRAESAEPRESQATPGDAMLGAHLREEMTAIRRMVGRLVHAAGPGAPTMPDALQKCYLRLLESEVASDIADELTNRVRERLTPAQLGDPGAVRDAVLDSLQTYIPSADAIPRVQRGGDGRPMTIALVGPTGVGKTTTIAKLAATYKLRKGLSVGLLTSDTYRIAAVEQLRTYASIIGLPLHVALTPAEMTRGCEALRDRDVILIDTAGRAPADSGRLDELARFLRAASPHQVHLVLSSAASESSIARAAERFAPVSPSHVIFTKLDEAVNFGVLVNIGRRINARLSFFTTGQEVPDQIEAGDAARIARLVLDGGPLTSATEPRNGAVL